MQPGIWQLLIVAALVLILFGRGRISEMMGDFGKGIKSFKEGVRDEKPAEPARPLIESPAPTSPVDSTSKSEIADKN